MLRDAELMDEIDGYLRMFRQNGTEANTGALFLAHV